jgi:voltage-gated potassium channel
LGEEIKRVINGITSRHGLAWDIGMALLALVYVLLGVFEDHPRGVLTEAHLAPLEVLITLAFCAEFALRFYAAPSRRGYMRGHWIDLLALLPAIRMLRFLRFGRLVYLLDAARVLRFGVLIRLLVEVERAGRRIRWIAMRNGVHILFPAAFGLVFIGGALVWQLEHATNPDFRDFGNAIWWAFATMATVGYGNGPQTIFGRLVAGFIMVAGIACFGMITATVTAYFFERVRDGAKAEEARVEAKEDTLLTLLTDIQARLERLERAIPLVTSSRQDTTEGTTDAEDAETGEVRRDDGL